MTASPLNWKRALALVASLGVGVVFWNNPVLWPLKVLVVMMHETGHAVATWLVGGHVERVVIAANQSGECLSALPQGFLSQIVISSAGYVGSAIAGAALTIGVLRFRLRRSVLGGMCVWLAVMGLIYGGDAFTLAFCIGTALALGAAVRWLPEGPVEVLTVFLAAFTGLYSLFDLRDDLWNSQVRAHSDAGILAGVTGIPSVVWAVLWTLLSVAILVAAFVWAVRRSGPRLPAARLSALPKLS